jgi:hypothetical protein
MEPKLFVSPKLSIAGSDYIHKSKAYISMTLANIIVISLLMRTTITYLPNQETSKHKNQLMVIEQQIWLH